VEKSKYTTLASSGGRVSRTLPSGGAGGLKSPCLTLLSSTDWGDYSSFVVCLKGFYEFIKKFI
jgi:hypothetical protein